MYKLTKSINCKLFDCDHQIWCDILSFDIDTCYYFENVYLPLYQYMMWKIVHGAIPAGRYLYECKFTDSSNCKFCGDYDDLSHIFL